MKTMSTTQMKKTTKARSDDDDIWKLAKAMKTMNTAKTRGERFSTRRKNY